MLVLPTSATRRGGRRPEDVADAPDGEADDKKPKRIVAMVLPTGLCPALSHILEAS